MWKHILTVCCDLNKLRLLHVSFDSGGHVRSAMTLSRAKRIRLTCSLLLHLSNFIWLVSAATDRLFSVAVECYFFTCSFIMLGNSCYIL